MLPVTHVTQALKGEKQIPTHVPESVRAGQRSHRPGATAPQSHPDFLTQSRLLVTQASLLRVLRGARLLNLAGTWGLGPIWIEPFPDPETHTGWGRWDSEAAWLRCLAWSVGLDLLGPKSAHHLLTSWASVSHSVNCEEQQNCPLPSQHSCEN